MISREEYNKALDTVEAYHKQLFLCGVGSSLRAEKKTRLLDWEKLHLCSTRTQRILERTYNQENEYNIKPLYIETLTWQKFKELSYAGKVSWTDFVKVRGY